MSWGMVAAGAATVVGGVMQKNSADDALASQEDQLAENQAFIKQQAAQSREDVIPLFDAAQENRQLGFQGALDIMGQAAPQQFSTFQQGNVGAQQALLSGQQQAQNAILGIPVDYGQMQPQTLQYNTDFTQQQLPQFLGGQQALDAAEEARGVGDAPVQQGSGVSSRHGFATDITDYYRNMLKYANEGGDMSGILAPEQPFEGKYYRQKHAQAEKAYQAAMKASQNYTPASGNLASTLTGVSSPQAQGASPLGGFNPQYNR